jgi:SAM-dependent methyltransferase
MDDKLPNKRTAIQKLLHFLRLSIDAISPSPIHTEYRLVHSLALLKGPKGLLLDAGCGSGILLAYLWRKGYRAIGIDIDKQTVERARERLRQAGFPPWVLVADVERMPFKDNAISTSIASEVLCTIKNPGVGFSELFRVLEDRGTLVASNLMNQDEEDMFAGQKFLRRLWPRFPWHDGMNNEFNWSSLKEMSLDYESYFILLDYRYGLQNITATLNDLWRLTGPLWKFKAIRAFLHSLSLYLNFFALSIEKVLIPRRRLGLAVITLMKKRDSLADNASPEVY